MATSFSSVDALDFVSRLEGYDPQRHWICPSDFKLTSINFLSKAARFFTPQKFSPLQVAQKLSEIAKEIGLKALREQRGVKLFYDKMASAHKYTYTKRHGFPIETEAYKAAKLLDSLFEMDFPYYENPIEERKEDIQGEFQALVRWKCLQGGPFDSEQSEIVHYLFDQQHEHWPPSDLLDVAQMLGPDEELGALVDGWVDVASPKQSVEIQAEKCFEQIKEVAHLLRRIKNNRRRYQHTFGGFSPSSRLHHFITREDFNQRSETFKLIKEDAKAIYEDMNAPLQKLLLKQVINHDFDAEIPRHLIIGKIF